MTEKMPIHVNYPVDKNSELPFVRSLCMNPEIILFDEVTAALDPEWYVKYLM